MIGLLAMQNGRPGKMSLGSYYNSKKVFVTGHTGFKGSWLTLWLNMLGADVKGYALAPDQENSLYTAIDGDSICDSVIADIRDLEKLKKEVPPGLVEWLPIPGLGPKRAAMIWKTLNITTFGELEAAAKEGKLRELPGMGSKSEAAILEGIASLSRRTVRIPLGRAYPIAQSLIAEFKKVKGVVDAQPGGSLRRMRDTVGDLDILVASKDPSAVMDMFVKLPRIHRVLGKGPTKASIEFNDGLRVQLWVHPPREFGTALVYATGSKEHNIRLREMALAKDLSLSDHSFKNILNGSEIFCATEEEVYETLGLPWIPPELREDRGEIQAAIIVKASASWRLFIITIILSVTCRRNHRSLGMNYRRVILSVALNGLYACWKTQGKPHCQD